MSKNDSRNSPESGSDPDGRETPSNSPSSSESIEQASAEIGSPSINPTAVPGRESLPTLVAAMHYSGPLPSPGDLEHYARIRPDLPERILAMAEREQSFRHEMTKESAGLQAREHQIADESLKRDHKFRTRGQFFAFTITLAILVAGVWLTFAGHPGVATTIISINLLGLVGAFLSDRFTSRQPDDSSDSNSEQRRG